MKSDKNSLTVIVPFYNEELFIGPLIDTLRVAAEEQDIFFLFVDDGSTDRSYEMLIDSLQKVNLKYKIRRMEKNCGKAKAIKEVAPEISTSNAAILDADLEVSIKDLLRMWEFLKQSDYDSVFGIRTFRSQSSFTYRYTIGNKFISNLFGMFFNSVMTDVMCGLKMFPSEGLRSCRFRSEGFAIEIEIAASLWSERNRIYEMEVDYCPRGWDQGKVIGWRDAIQIFYLFPLLRFLYRRK